MKQPTPLHDRLVEIAKTSGEDRIEKFRYFLSTTEVQTVHRALNQEATHRQANGQIQVTKSYLAYVLLRGKKEGLLDFVKLIIDAGTVTQGIHLEATKNNSADGLALIHIAAAGGHADIFELLVTQCNNSATQKTLRGQSVLDMLPIQLSKWKPFIKILKINDALATLCSHNVDLESNIFNKLLSTAEGIPIAYKLYEMIPDIYRKCYISETHLETLATNVMGNPAYYDLFRDCRNRQHFTASKNDNALTQHLSQIAAFSEPSTEYERFLTSEDPADAGMTRAINDFINHVLRNRVNLGFLLSLINEKLEGALRLQGIDPKLGDRSNQYSYQFINWILYPIPNENYRRIQKKTTLEQVLIQILKDAKMGDKPQKWFGFVPQEVANQSIYDGNFFIESQFGIGVFHGKFSHMLQWCLLVLAIQHGVIHVDENISAKSIIQYLITRQTEETKSNLFALYTDKLFFEAFTAQDPFRLCSLLTTGYFDESCETLGVYARDSFCSSYLQWLNAFNTESSTKLSADEFAELLHYASINTFATSTYTNEACIENIKRSIASGNTHKLTFFGSIKNQDNPYIIIEKDYNIEKDYRR